MVMKTKKPKKKMSGRHGHGASWRGSGRHGGCGMAGTGKKADHKKSLVIVKFKKYFGKQGITSMGTKRRKLKAINLREISQNFDSLMKKFGKGSELNLKDYKVLGEGELKEKITINAMAFTKSAKEKIEKAGGKAITPVVKKKEIKKTEIKGEKKEEKKEEIKKEEKK